MVPRRNEAAPRYRCQEFSCIVLERKEAMNTECSSKDNYLMENRFPLWTNKILQDGSASFSMVIASFVLWMLVLLPRRNGAKIRYCMHRISMFLVLHIICCVHHIVTRAPIGMENLLEMKNEGMIRTLGGLDTHICQLP